MDMYDADGNLWTQLSMMMGCSGCSNNTTVQSPHTCKVCGMMLCGECGEYCKTHKEDKDDN